MTWNRDRLDSVYIPSRFLSHFHRVLVVATALIDPQLQQDDLDRRPDRWGVELRQRVDAEPHPRLHSRSDPRPDRRSVPMVLADSGIPTLLQERPRSAFPFPPTLTDAPGPRSDHWLWGNLKGIIKAGPMEEHARWLRTYGSTYRYHTFLNGSRFFTVDPTAMSFILSHSDIFIKPPQIQKNLNDMLGNGVLIAEGADHRRQRKILNPAFSPAALREMVPIFLDKAYELKDKLQNMIDDESIEASPTPPKAEDVVPGARKIDVMRYLAQATLDVIGIAGFAYDFKSLSEPNNELAEAYRNMFGAGQSITFMAVLQAFVPGMKYLVRGGG